MDNDWFAYVILLKQGWPKAQGLIRHKATKSNWAKSNREFPLPLYAAHIPIPENTTP
jgi:hypothetical protein